MRRMSTRVLGGTVQSYLHESDFDLPIPAPPPSDGTIRFVVMRSLDPHADPRGAPFGIAVFDTV